MTKRLFSVTTCCLLWTGLAGSVPPSPILPLNLDRLIDDSEAVGERPVPFLLLDPAVLADPKPAAQFAAEAEALILAGRFDEAGPLLDALSAFPDMALQTNFMKGYIALQRSDYAAAERLLRAAVAVRPDYGRAHAELGRALMALKKRKEADEQFRIAQQDRNLPPEIIRIVRESRRITAEKAVWRLAVDAGVAADSNINNGTGLHTIDVNFGDVTIPVPVDPALRRRSGIGESLSVDTGLRLHLSERAAIAFDGDARIDNFDGSSADDVSLLIAAGPQLTTDSGAIVFQATAFERWYGGTVSSVGVGLRARYQDQLAKGRRLYLFVDTRIFDSDYGGAFAGTQASAFLVYEHVFDTSLSGSLTLYTRREWLGSDSFSNTEFGLYAGLNTLLPLGLRGGASAGATRVLYDDPLVSLSPDPRHDWRLSGSLFLTTRQAVLLGIWPTLRYSYTTTSSTIPFYRTDRHRLRLGLWHAF